MSKELTKEDALKEVFGRKRLSSMERVWKHRYMNGKLSEVVENSILQSNGYEISKEALYVKK